jgi:hypothetical protein
MMADTMISVQIPFEALLRTVETLSIDEKRLLWEALAEEMEQMEEADWARSPHAQALLQEARTAYKTGDFVSVNDFIDQTASEG